MAVLRKRQQQQNCAAPTTAANAGSQAQQHTGHQTGHHNQHTGHTGHHTGHHKQRTGHTGHHTGHHKQQHKQHKQHHDPVVKKVCNQLAANKKQTQDYTQGTLCFGALLFAAGAAPWLLPWLFVLFAVVCLPWRTYNFIKQKWVFFLIDFCYFVNVAAVLFLLLAPEHKGLETLVYTLSDGPLAGALVAWQCPWIFGSAEHTTSVLMHLLPGLALFAHRYHTPTGLRGLRNLAATTQQLLMLHNDGHAAAADLLGVVPAAEQPTPLWLWLVAAPLAFYIAWQLLYFLVVQVACRSFILQHGYDTSYTCLARRAAKTNNVWNRLVRRGSISRRICMYGALQLAFTVISCTVFLPTYFSYWAAAALQVVKVAFAVYYGQRYLCEKVPQHVFLRGMQLLDAHKQQQEEEQQQALLQQQQREHDQALHAVAAALCSGCQSLLQRRSCAAEVAAATSTTSAPAMQPALVM